MIKDKSSYFTRQDDVSIACLAKQIMPTGLKNSPCCCTLKCMNRAGDDQ